MDPVAAKLLLFMMVMTRISAFVLVVPVFSWKTIPVRIKSAIILLLTIFFVTVKPAPPAIYTDSIFQIILLLLSEATFGLAMGLVLALIFGAVKLSGRTTGRQMGLALANILDPLSGEQAQPIGMFLEIIFILLFLSANGHHLLLMTLSRSYDVFAAGTIPSISQLTTSVAQAGSVMFLAALRLAAPILAAFLLLLVTLAVLARCAPEMNILFVSLPIRIGLGFFMTMLMIPLINGFVSEFAEWMNKILPL